MNVRELSDRQLALLESQDLSRRRMIRDVCAATGWVFFNGALLTRTCEATFQGDSTNNDKKWGSVKGRLVYDGQPPKMNEIDLDKLGLSAEDLKWFKSMGPVLNQEWVIDPSSKSIQWVIVWLLPEDPKGKIETHPSLLEIPKDKKLVAVDQEPSGYVPHAIALQLGQGILMRNKGPVAHVFRLTGFVNDPFNQNMPSGSEIAIEDIKLEKAAMQINCPPHPWERLWLRNFTHPYFAVTDAQGNFEIKHAPAGKCRLVVWHEQAGFLGGKTGKDGSIIDIEGAAITDLGDIKLAAKI